MSSGTTIIKRAREAWVDNVKLIACIFVAVGHFAQSMVASDLLPDTALYEWFNWTIYTFHVPLFFICSGYLYQRYARIDSLRERGGFIVRKLVCLGVPYVAFTGITLAFKSFAGDAVNTEGGYLEYAAL